MKLYLLFLAIAAAATLAAGFQENVPLDKDNVAVEVSAPEENELLIRHRRVVTPAPQPIMKDTFMAKHVARAGEMQFTGRVGSTRWTNSIENFAKNKANDGYTCANPQRRLASCLPDSYSLIEMRNKNDFKNLRQDYNNRQADANGNFVTDHEYKVHEFSKKDDGISYDYERTHEANLELGVRNEEVNHFQSTVRCRNNGRQPARRHQRSVFRSHGRLCTRTWINPAPPESSTGGRTGSGSSGSGTGGSNGSTRPRACRRGFRRVGRRCVRIRRRQHG